MLVCFASLALSALLQEKVSFDERVIGKIPNDLELRWDVAWAPTGRHVVYAAERGGRWLVVDNGKRGEEFDYVWQPVLGADGKVSAYSGRRGTKHFVVVDGKRSEPYDEVDSEPLMSPDARTVAYWAQQRGEKRALIVGGQTIANHSRIGATVFSPDGARIAYGASDGQGWFMTVAGERGESCLQTCVPSFSPSGDAVAYGMRLQGKCVMTLNGKVVAEHKDIRGWAPAFSPDGKSIAYEVKEEAGYRMAMGDQTGPFFHLVSSPVFGPDNRTVAYIAYESAGKAFLMVGDRKSPGYEDVMNPAFSPDGKTVAYAGRVNLKWVVFAGDRKSPPFDHVSRLHFSPDGRKLAFGARDDRTISWKVMTLR